jgi:hypothetical protein
VGCFEPSMVCFWDNSPPQASSPRRCRHPREINYPPIPRRFLSGFAEPAKGATTIITFIPAVVAVLKACDRWQLG